MNKSRSSETQLVGILNEADTSSQVSPIRTPSSSVSPDLSGRGSGRLALLTVYAPVEKANWLSRPSIRLVFSSLVGVRLIRPRSEQRLESAERRSGERIHRAVKSRNNGCLIENSCASTGQTRARRMRVLDWPRGSSNGTGPGG